MDPAADGEFGARLELADICGAKLFCCERLCKLVNCKAPLCSLNGQYTRRSFLSGIPTPLAGSPKVARARSFKATFSPSRLACALLVNWFAACVLLQDKVDSISEADERSVNLAFEIVTVGSESHSLAPPSGWPVSATAAAV